MILNERSAAPGNGRPEFRPYRYGASRPAWMARALQLAEAQHGPPVPTCVCGARLPLKTRDEATWTCAACGHKTGPGPKAASTP